MCVFLVQYLLHTQLSVVGLLLLTTVMGTVLIAFTIYHFSLVAKNTTTNETFKWRTVQYAVEFYREERVKVGHAD